MPGPAVATLTGQCLSLPDVKYFDYPPGLEGSGTVVLTTSRHQEVNRLQDCIYVSLHLEIMGIVLHLWSQEEQLPAGASGPV